MASAGPSDPMFPAPPNTAEECREQVATSIDRAVEESCVLRSEFLDLAFELDSRATVLEAIAQEQGDKPNLLASKSVTRLPVIGARVVQTPDQPLRYKVVLEHVGGTRTEHPVASIAEGEAIIRSTSPAATAGVSKMRQAPAPRRNNAGLRLV
jgi:hypothetical protein